MQVDATAWSGARSGSCWQERAHVHEFEREGLGGTAGRNVVGGCHSLKDVLDARKPLSYKSSRVPK